MYTLCTKVNTTDITDDDVSICKLLINKPLVSQNSNLWTHWFSSLWYHNSKCHQRLWRGYSPFCRGQWIICQSQLGRQVINIGHPHAEYQICQNYCTLLTISTDVFTFLHPLISVTFDHYQNKNWIVWTNFLYFALNMRYVHISFDSKLVIILKRWR